MCPRSKAGGIPPENIRAPITLGRGNPTDQEKDMPLVIRDVEFGMDENERVDE